jgi:hypothetical protein
MFAKSVHPIDIIIYLFVFLKTNSGFSGVSSPTASAPRSSPTTAVAVAQASPDPSATATFAHTSTNAVMLQPASPSLLPSSTLESPTAVVATSTSATAAASASLLSHSEESVSPVTASIPEQNLIQNAPITPTGYLTNEPASELSSNRGPSPAKNASPSPTNSSVQSASELNRLFHS